MPAPTTGRLLALLLAALLAFTACSDDGGDGPADDPSDPTSGSSAVADEPYLPVPDGVELTAQGSDLAVGDTATVAYEPRQDVVGALEITVTKLEKATFKLFVGWRITDEIKSTAPYFVRAEITNVGESDLGGRDVPLYAVDGDNRLVEASILGSSFKACPSQPFPEAFGPGDSTKVCLVYLAPDRGDLTAVSFRPTQEFDGITWTGDVVEAKVSRDMGDEKDKKKNRG